MSKMDTANVTDTDNDIVVIASRDSKGGNAKFSDKLNEQIQTAASYAVGAFRNFKSNWDEIKETAKEEGISIEECEVEYRHQIRGKLTKHQMYYLFHSDEVKLSEKQRRLERKQLVETAKQIVKQNDENSRNVATSETKDEHEQEQREDVRYSDRAQALLNQLDNESMELTSSTSPTQKYGKKEFEALKTEVEMLRAENAELKEKQKDVISEGLLIELANTLYSDEELGQKVRFQVREDPRFKGYLKKEKAKAKRQKAKSKSKIKKKSKKNKRLGK